MQPKDNGGMAGNKFPGDEHATRLRQYGHYDLLFDGKHFEAFAQKIHSNLYGQNYARLKYVVVNFAGLISKVSADMLFGEGIQVKGGDKKQQAWLNALMFDNKLPTQLYESATINSRLGDDILKIRSAPRGTSTESTLIIEEVRPDIYFPKFKNNNWRANPEYQDLAFKVKIAAYPSDEFVRVERHYPGEIHNFLYKIGQDGKMEMADIRLYDDTLTDLVETGIDRSLIVHVPNWRSGNYWGISDYSDLETLMYALNNRMTKNENVLDKHTDPILALPEGVLNEKGQLDKKALEIYVVPENEMGSKPSKPEYITWNANLESSFTQIDKLVEFLFMTSETSPGVFGMDKEGQAESGRALKLKLMRTIAKINRKKLFYDQGIKEALYVSQLLAAKHGYQVLGERLPGTPVVPDILWSDGLPIDDYEAVELQNKRLEAGTQSKQDAIAILDQIDDEDAKDKLERITNETAVPVPLGATVPAVPGESDDEG